MNAFANSLNARHAFEATRTMSDANLKKLQKAARIASTDASNELLAACSVSEDFANASVIENKRVDVYAVEKMMNFVFCAQFMSNNMNEVNRVIFNKLRAYHDVNAEFTKDDAITALNYKAMSHSTITAQHRSTLAALLMLNVISKYTNEAMQTCYRVNADNALYTKLCEQLDAE